MSLKLKEKEEEPFSDIDVNASRKNKPVLNLRKSIPKKEEPEPAPAMEFGKERVIEEPGFREDAPLQTYTERKLWDATNFFDRVISNTIRGAFGAVGIKKKD